MGPRLSFDKLRMSGQGRVQDERQGRVQDERVGAGVASTSRPE